MGRTTEHTDIALTAEDALLIEDIYHKASETYGESLEWADATRDDQIEIIGDDITCIAGNSLIAIDEHFDVYPRPIRRGVPPIYNGQPAQRRPGRYME